MTKCPRCGFSDPYWLKAFNSRYLEYAHLSDIPEAKNWPLGVVIEKDGIAYWRTKKYAYRKDIEIFRVEGKSDVKKGYWDNTNFDKAHHRKGTDDRDKPLVITYKPEDSQ